MIVFSGNKVKIRYLMDKAIEIINELREKGLIKDYAIGGGILHKYGLDEKFKLYEGQSL